MQQQRDMTVTEPILKVMFACTFESDHFRVKGLNCSLFSPTVSTLSGLKCIETRSEVSADSQANAVLLAMLTSLDGYIRTKPQRAAALPFVGWDSQTRCTRADPDRQCHNRHFWTAAALWLIKVWQQIQHIRTLVALVEHDSSSFLLLLDLVFYLGIIVVEVDSNENLSRTHQDLLRNASKPTCMGKRKSRTESELKPHFSRRNLLTLMKEASQNMSLWY